MRWLVMVLILFSCIEDLNADDFKPIMIYEIKPILDKSWNEEIHKGIKAFEQRSGVSVKEVTVLPVDLSNISSVEAEKLYVDAVINYASEGYNPLIIDALSEEAKSAIKSVLVRYPEKRFIVLNGIFNIPNANFLVFSHHEGSFLAGYLAAKKSKSKKIGFVGGLDVLQIRNYLCGFIKGARLANPDVRVEHSFIGTNFDAWDNPNKAYTLAVQQIENDVDVIFGVAGKSTVGVLKAAADNGVYGIGVDNNQNHLFPGSVLTSVVIRVDVAVYRALLISQRNIWREEVKIIGLQEKGVGLAFDENNSTLVSQELMEEIEQVKADVILNKINLPHYRFVNECKEGGVELF